ncbi:MAG: TetR/AcrR family transcriptional regulator, partial [Bradyrhizobium sp.]|nr:TetR/AcrR family transcriptional regulator [Bradyrhizobium sp.]
NRSLTDRERKGCMLVNTALELAPHDAEFREIASGMLKRIEAFFLECVHKGHADGTIAHSASPNGLAAHLLSVLMGVRVLARVRPETALLEGIVSQALALLNR